MKRILVSALALALLAIPSVKGESEIDRLHNCGTVLREIMDIPEDIPQDLIDKAECIVVYPSVLKAAFIVGGSYGRGAMTCRTGKEYSGHWSAPTMMALEGGSIGFQIGGQATDFVLLVMNPRGAHAILHSKVKLGADASAPPAPKAAPRKPPRMPRCVRKFSAIRVTADCLRAFRWKAPPFAPTMMPTTASTAKGSRRMTLFSATT